MSAALDEMDGRWADQDRSYQAPAAPPPLPGQVPDAELPTAVAERLSLRSTKLPIGISTAVTGAVAAVKAEIERINKRGQNKHFNFSYATIDDIREKVAELAGKNGLAWRQDEAGLIPFGKLLAITYYFALQHKDEPACEAFPEHVTVFTSLQTKGGLDDKAFSKARALAWKDWAKGKFSIPTGEDSEPAHDGDPDSGEGAPSDRDLRRGPPPRRPEGPIGAIIHRARAANGADDGHDLLALLARRAAEVEKLRGSREWDALRDEVGAALQRSLNREAATAWAGYLRATTTEHLDALAPKWEREWAPALSAIREAAPATYKLLRDHVHAQAARINDAPKAQPGGMLEHVRQQAAARGAEKGPDEPPANDTPAGATTEEAGATEAPSGPPAEDGKPEALTLIAPDGAEYAARAKDGKSVEQVWLGYVKTALTRMGDPAKLADWYRKNDPHFAAVRQHHPETAKQATAAYTAAFQKADGAKAAAGAGRR